MSNSRTQLERYLHNLVIKADAVLDIGGSQKPIMGRTMLWEVREYSILDLPQPHECVIKPSFTIDLNSGQQMLDFSNHYAGKFDVIFCLEVSEYLLNPLLVLSYINKLLADNGVLYISFHFNYPVHKPHGLDYLRYTEYGAKELLKRAGFNLTETTYKRYTPTGYELYKRLNEVEGNKPDREYEDHNAQGCIIKATKSI